MTVALTIFRNEHFSVSRLKKFEACALSFFFSYIAKGPKSPLEIAPRFGVMLHAALEGIFEWVVREEFAGYVETDILLDAYRTAWKASELTSLELYQEGLTIVRRYCNEMKVDHLDILGIEVEFLLDLGPNIAKLLGYIDRIDRVDDDTVEVVDYKSNRLLYTRNELETDLQMTIYGAAVRRKYPWVKNVQYAFHMLRFGTVQRCRRTLREIDDGLDFVRVLGEMTERVPSIENYAPTLNANCGYCDHRERCAKYQEALETKTSSIAKVVAGASWDEIATARERLAKLAKYAYAQKANLDDLIKARLAAVGPFDAGGYHYRTIDMGENVIDSPRALRALVKASGLDPVKVIEAVGTVENPKIDRFIASLPISRKAAQLLKADVGSMVDKKMTTSKMDSHAIKEAPTGDSARKKQKEVAA